MLFGASASQKFRCLPWATLGLLGLESARRGNRGASGGVGPDFSRGTHRSHGPMGPTLLGRMGSGRPGPDLFVSPLIRYLKGVGGCCQYQSNVVKCQRDGKNWNRGLLKVLPLFRGLRTPRYATVPWANGEGVCLELK